MRVMVTGGAGLLGEDPVLGGLPPLEGATGHDHVGPARGELRRSRPADARVRAGDDDDGSVGAHGSST